MTSLGPSASYLDPVATDGHAHVDSRALSGHRLQLQLELKPVVDRCGYRPGGSMRFVLQPGHDIATPGPNRRAGLLVEPVARRIRHLEKRFNGVKCAARTEGHADVRRGMLLGALAQEKS